MMRLTGRAYAEGEVVRPDGMDITLLGDSLGADRTPPRGDENDILEQLTKGDGGVIAKCLRSPHEILRIERCPGPQELGCFCKKPLGQGHPAGIAR